MGAIIPLDHMVVMWLQNGKALEGLPAAITLSDMERFGGVSHARLCYILGLDNPSAAGSAGSIVIRSISPSGVLEACVDSVVVSRQITGTGYKEINGAYVPA
ncbi:hypothetical protein HYV82_06810 [Candidatus Woesearchaeota archaeon]|nr:hypothetical protein [Candidatus Woesearchaeota archaeon]